MPNWKVLIVGALAVGITSIVAVQVESRGTKAYTLTALDYVEIEQLTSRAAHALDTCGDKGNEFADLFTPDGVYVYADGHKIEGRKSLAELAGGPDCAPPKSALNIGHVFVNEMIEPSAEGAIGKCYFLSMTIDEKGKPALRSAAKLYDVYIKTAAGWRFKSRTFVQSPHLDHIPASELSHHPLPH